MKVTQEMMNGFIDMGYSNEYIKKPIPIVAVKMETEFEVDTLEGTMRGKNGDYLIRGIEGELYPCDKGIIEKSYMKYLKTE